MKHHKTTILAGAVALSLINTITLHAEVVADRAYLGFDAGVALVQDLTIKSAGFKTTFDPGLRFDIRAGYQVTEGFSVELQSGLIYNSMDQAGGISLSSIGASSDLYQIPLMVNAIYNFKLGEPFSFYLGAGLGGVVGDFQRSAFGSSSDNWDTTFGYQAMAGFKYAFDSGWELGLGYKFLGTTEHDLGSGFKSDGTKTHSVLLAFSHKF
jgi:opacity protein-like surface antigen